MDGQLVSQIQAWDHSVSFHYTFAPHAAIAEVSLAAKYDHDNWAVPLAHAIVAFTRVSSTAGTTDVTGNLTHVVLTNNMTGVEGLLIADNCYAGAIFNVFFWPGVA